MGAVSLLTQAHIDTLAYVGEDYGSPAGLALELITLPL